jgi:hypothetical protein
MGVTAAVTARRRLLGALLYRPWFDQVAVRAIAGWYFPLSRAWAAGRAAAGDMDAFLSAMPGCRPSPTLARALAALVSLDRRHVEASEMWEEGFFGSRVRELASLERRRRAAAARLMAARRLFVGLRLRGLAPALRWELADLATVERRHGARLAGGSCAFQPPEPARIEASRPIRLGGRQTYWLRFPSSILGDRAWARVVEPVGRSDPPTLICQHGIGVEAEFWPDPHDSLNVLVDAGVRVVRPEGPWHGRRALPGFFGGEPVLARAPLGILDYFRAAVAEAGALIGWARAGSRGAVAVGGVSLGALASESLACAARSWPAALAPDALLLIAPGGGFVRIVLESALTRRLGLPERLSASGWDAAALARFLPLAEPRGAPAPAPDRIVAALGAADEVTPYADARALVDAWRIPPQNVFVAPKGHFSLSLDAGGLERPLARLVALLQG